MHPWFSARGYACLRVDLRGSGDSEGVLEDEYLPREFDDGVAVIEGIFWARIGAKNTKNRGIYTRDE